MFFSYKEKSYALMLMIILLIITLLRNNLIRFDYNIQPDHLSLCDIQLSLIRRSRHTCLRFDMKFGLWSVRASERIPTLESKKVLHSDTSVMDNLNYICYLDVHHKNLKKCSMTNNSALLFIAWSHTVYYMISSCSIIFYVIKQFYDLLTDVSCSLLNVYCNL